MSEDRPVMLFDGLCGFCRRWVERWRHLTGEAIDYQPYQEAGGRFPQIAADSLGRAVHLVEAEGRVTRGAGAVFRAMALAGYRRWPWGIYSRFKPFAVAAEGVYALVAGHRDAAERIDLFLLGRGTEPTTYHLTRQIFLRGLAVVYAMAFLSLWTQIDGLVGSNGILPIHSLLERAQSVLGNERYSLLPTLCWVNDSNGFLHLLCGAGVACAASAAIGVGQLPAFVGMYVCYLSLCVAGQDFLGFQWDVLLTEAGFLAIFFAPWRVWVSVKAGASARAGSTANANAGANAPPSRVILWLLRWLLFRVMFMSGVVKLASGDPSWRSLTALQFHYQTQPLPTWTSWYAQQLPAWFARFSCAGVFFFELIVPLLIIGPRRVRLAAYWLIVGFQLLIAATGNYGFFNLLTIVLCVTLADDAFWRGVLRWVPRWALRREAAANQRTVGRLGWAGWITVPVGAVLLALTLPDFVGAFGKEVAWPAPLMELRGWAGPLRIANGYGLFAVMTTHRPELIVEGSEDGVEWKAYGFKWKPGDVAAAPRFTTPHMPRLDWQMWFAALGGPNDSPWLYGFLNGLLKGSSDVLGLMGENPFAGRPPRQVRVVMYEYRFTTSAERAASGAWWGRREVGVFCQVSD